MFEVVLSTVYGFENTRLGRLDQFVAETEENYYHYHEGDYEGW
jgi:hypothetical protein